MRPLLHLSTTLKQQHLVLSVANTENPWINWATFNDFDVCNVWYDNTYLARTGCTQMAPTLKRHRATTQSKCWPHQVKFPPGGLRWQTMFMFLILRFNMIWHLNIEQKHCSCYWTAWWRRRIVETVHRPSPQGGNLSLCCEHFTLRHRCVSVVTIGLRCVNLQVRVIKSTCYMCCGPFLCYTFLNW